MKKLPLFFILLSLMVLVFAQDGASQKYLQQGKQMYVDGKYSEAIKMFTKLINLEPENAEAYYERGRVNHEIKNFLPAIHDLDKAIELDAKHEKAFYVRGYTRLQIGNNQGAINDLNVALELNPKSALALAYRGEALLAIGKINEACDDWIKAYELGYRYANDLMRANCDGKEQSLAVYVNDLLKKGDAKLGHGDYQGALVIYSEAVELFPNSSEAYFNRGLAELILGELAKACEDWQKASQLGDMDAPEMIKQHCN